MKGWKNQTSNEEQVESSEPRGFLTTQAGSTAVMLTNAVVMVTAINNRPP